jgi:hypothetical protein
LFGFLPVRRQNSRKASDYVGFRRGAEKHGMGCERRRPRGS